jgi:hypothetical protein
MKHNCYRWLGRRTERFCVGDHVECECGKRWVLCWDDNFWLGITTTVRWKRERWWRR